MNNVVNIIAEPSKAEVTKFSNVRIVDLDNNLFFKGCFRFVRDVNFMV